MTYWDKKLIREQLNAKLAGLRSIAIDAGPKGGWIKTLREALGMSTKQLGKRIGLSQPRVSRLENAEASGDLKLSSLKKIAEGLDMKFVYGFVPRQSLEDIVVEQARKIALARLNKVSHTMRLEDQELTPEEKQKALDDLTQKILIDEPKDFWDR